MKHITIISVVLAVWGLALPVLSGAQGPAEDPLVKTNAAATSLGAGKFQPSGAPVTLAAAAKADQLVDIEWITIPRGKFMMGSNDSEFGRPVHEVNVPTFQIAKTLVTIEQYKECVDKHQCTEPDVKWSEYCNWRYVDRTRHPVNCIDWNQAQQYAKFKGARLPSEAQWEFAARGGGQNIKYPWGNEDPTPERAVYGDEGTQPVCSKPLGNTSQGLCDMAGNVWEWMQDTWHDSYRGAPTDGSAWEKDSSDRSFRGGSWSFIPESMRSAQRFSDVPDSRYDFLGFRLVRSVP